MQIPDPIRLCVCFIGFRDGEREVFGGTGFFFAHTSPSRIQERMSCVITAKHNIERMRRKGSKTALVRFRAMNGKTIVAETDLAAWQSHPDDPYVDVAILPMLDAGEDFNRQAIFLFSSEDVLTEERIKFEPIGPGDDVFFPGLFTSHYGDDRHIPIMRVGNIAAMPEEKVRIDWFGDKVAIEAFLIEARSIGGLSGSPAFVHVGMHRFRERLIVPGDDLPAKLERKIVVKPNRFYFLGLVHGHYDLRDHKDGDEEEGERINSGIAIVVPAWTIVDVIKRVAAARAVE